MNLVLKNDKFLTTECFSQNQYFEIYRKRLEAISPYIIPHLPKPFAPHMNQIMDYKECSIVGVIYKDLVSRSNMIEEFKELGTDTQSLNDLTTSEGDKLYIEDSTGRIHLLDLDPVRYPTGVVLGIYGRIEANKFYAINVIEPVSDPAPPLSYPEYQIAFLSSIRCNGKDWDKAASMKLGKDLQKCDLCVLLGNNFAPPQKSQNETLSFQAKMQLIDTMPINILVSFLSFAKCKILLMPGENDPCTLRLPQQPYHKVLINSDQIELGTNPSMFEIDGNTFYCGSGESPVDITKTTNLTFHEAQENLLKWRHYAPTTPDHIDGTPKMDCDPLVIEKMPNIFVCGNAPEFKKSKLNGTIVISVPAFSETKAAVFLNMKSGEVTLRNY